MSKQDQIRKSVSRAYAEAVTTGDGCCGGSSCCATDESSVGPKPKGVAAKTAGYSAEELASLPVEAAVNSFGCGNPTAFAGVKEGEIVVDLGSGAGIDLLLAAQKVGTTGKVIGIDMTDEMIARARQAIRSAGVENTVEVRKGLIEELPVEDASVDLVISNCVINLSPEKPRVFKEISRVLKPGGRMSVSDIVVEQLPWWLRRIPSVYSSCVGGAISEKEYIAGLEGAGLEEVEVLERLVYDANQMTGLVLSEVPGFFSTFVRRFGLVFLVRFVTRRLEGKIWSAKFSARKLAASASGVAVAPAA